DLPTPRGGLGATVVGNRLITAGGESSTGVFGTVEIFDINANTWAPGPAMRTPRHGLALVSVEGTVYALAGARQASHAASPPPALREPAAFRGWLLTIAHRAAINQRAFRGREQSLETTDSEALPDGGRQPDDLAALGELAEFVRGAVAGLSARDAAAVRLVTD